MRADMSGAIFRKSSRSGDADNCVEVAMNVPGVVAVRDSKQHRGPVLLLSRPEWSNLIRRIKDDESA